MSSHKYDDTSSDIQYSGTWRSGGVEAEYNGTTHVAEKTGSSMLITFEGTSIGVYGTVTLSEAVSQYSIDNVSLSTYKAPSRSSTEYGKLFFQSPLLPNGKHTLFVTSLSDHTFYVDFLVITTEGTGPSASNPTPQNITLTVTGETMVPTVFTTPSPSPSPSNTTDQGPLVGPTSGLHLSLATNTNQRLPVNTTLLGSQSSPTPEANSQPQTQNTINAQPSGSQSPPSNQLPIGAIAGGATTGVLVIAFIIFFLWRYRRRSVNHTAPFTYPSSACRSTNDSLASLFISPTDERRSPQNGEVSPFVDLSSSTNQGNTHNMFTNSALNSGHIKKPSYHDISIFTHNPPMANLTLDLGAQSLFPAVPWDTTDDSVPPTYSHIFENSGV